MKYRMDESEVAYVLNMAKVAPKSPIFLEIPEQPIDEEAWIRETAMEVAAHTVIGMDADRMFAVSMRTIEILRERLPLLKRTEDVR